MLAAEGLSASPTKSRPYAARNLDAALGPAPAPFSLDDDGPVGFDLPGLRGRGEAPRPSPSPSHKAGAPLLSFLVGAGRLGAVALRRAPTS